MNLLGFDWHVVHDIEHRWHKNLTNTWDGKRELACEILRTMLDYSRKQFDSYIENWSNISNNDIKDFGSCNLKIIKNNFGCFDV